MFKGDPIDALHVFERDEWMCGVCQEKIDPKRRGQDWMRATIDHVLPLSKGGAHVYSNVVAAHYICNSMKADMVVGVDISQEELVREITCEIRRCQHQECLPPNEMVGERFGLLTVMQKSGKRWDCLCDCGAYRQVRHSDLVDLKVDSCVNIKIHKKQLDVSYDAMIGRVRNERGKAYRQKCQYCPRQAKYWQYDKSDDCEVFSEYGPYSLDLDRYEPVCTNCHNSATFSSDESLTLGLHGGTIGA